MAACATCLSTAELALDPEWLCINMGDSIYQHHCEADVDNRVECRCTAAHPPVVICHPCYRAGVLGVGEFGANPTWACTRNGDILPEHECERGYLRCRCGCNVTRQEDVDVCMDCMEAARNSPDIRGRLPEEFCVESGHRLPDHRCSPREYPTDNPGDVCDCACRLKRPVCNSCFREAATQFDATDPDELCHEGGRPLPPHRCEGADDFSVNCLCACGRPSVVCEDCLDQAQERLTEVGEEHYLDPQWVCINQADSLSDHDCEAEDDPEVICRCSYGHSYSQSGVCNSCISVVADIDDDYDLDPSDVCKKMGDSFKTHDCRANYDPKTECQCLCNRDRPTAVCEECISVATDMSEAYDLDPARVCVRMGDDLPDHHCHAKDDPQVACKCLGHHNGTALSVDDAPVS